MSKTKTIASGRLLHRALETALVLVLLSGCEGRPTPEPELDGGFSGCSCDVSSDCDIDCACDTTWVRIL